MYQTPEDVIAAQKTPPAPRYREEWLAHMRHQQGGPPATNPRWSSSPCEVCGDPMYKFGWCRTHYRVANRERSAAAPFDPQPQKKPGRPSIHEGEQTTITISKEVARALDHLRSPKEARSLVAEALLRHYLKLPPTKAMLRDLEGLDIPLEDESD